MTRPRRAVNGMLAAAAAVFVFAAAPSPDRRKALDSLATRLRDAQVRQDEAAVVAAAAAARHVLGDDAGVPEEPDVFRPSPADVPPLTPDEVRGGFAVYLRQLPTVKWWRVGLDPTRTPHLPREPASVLAGCAAAARAKLAGHEQAMAEAREAADYLVWTQQQAGAGVFPFPDVRSDDNRALQVGTRFLRRAEQAGQLGRITRNGWVFDDLGDGGLQFDNGVCGAAMLDLYAVAGDARYLASARSAGDWAVERQVVANWNYNAFSVWLLARLHAATGEAKYLSAAKAKARLGIYPGQLTDGPRAGRWGDPHNARPVYHYILVRGVAALAAELPPNDPDRPAAVACLRRALLARNPEFAARGVSNKDQALEALLVVRSSPALAAAPELRDCATDEAIAAIERLAAAEYRAGKGPLSPGAWGRLLAWKAAAR